MGMFVSVKIDAARCDDPASCARCVRVCPVDAFVLQDGQLLSVYDSEDECTLCDLCREQCPRGAVEIIKLY